MNFTNKETLVNETIKHFYPEVTEETLGILKTFIEARYEEKGIYEQYSVLYGYWDLPHDEQMEIAHLMCDLTDFYLRVTYDEISKKIVAYGLEDSTEYLLRKLYNVKSNNDYDYNFLFSNLNQEGFIKYVTDQLLNLAYIDGKLYEIKGY